MILRLKRKIFLLPIRNFEVNPHSLCGVVERVGHPQL